MTHFPYAVIGTAAAALALLGGCRRAANDATAPPPVDVVVTSPLVKPIVEWDEYVGRLEAVDSVDVRSRVSGYLTAIHFEEGQIVEAGERLFTIDQRPFAAEVRRAEADVAEAKARIEQNKALRFEAEANERAAQARFELEEKQLKRTEALLPSRAATQDEYDIQASELTQAEAVREAAKAEIESAQAAIITSEAAVATAESQLAIAELNLEYTEVNAPIAGRMSKRFVTEGNLISGGTEQSTLLTTIVSLNPIHCYFDADEQSFLKYTRLAEDGSRQSSRDVKNPVYVALADESSSFPHWGHMDFVDNRMDMETGTLRARAVLANPDKFMIPGMFVRLRLPGSGRFEAVMLPDMAISFDQSEKYVYVVSDDSSVSRQVITTGPIVQGLRVVRKGLTGKEKIILRGQQRVRPGVKVAAKDEAIAARTDDGLPDDYEPVPREKWLSKEAPAKAADAEQPTPAEPKAKVNADSGTNAARL